MANCASVEVSAVPEVLCSWTAPKRRRSDVDCPNWNWRMSFPLEENSLILRSKQDRSRDPVEVEDSAPKSVPIGQLLWRHLGANPRRQMALLGRAVLRM